MTMTFEDIKKEIKEEMFRMLLEKGEVTGRITLSSSVKDDRGRDIKSFYFEKGRLVKVYSIESSLYDGEIIFDDIEVKESFYFYEEGEVLLFTYRDDHFTIDEIP